MFIKQNKGENVAIYVSPSSCPDNSTAARRFGVENLAGCFALSEATFKIREPATQPFHFIL